MIDNICSIHFLTRALIDIPDEINYIFNKCNDFLGKMYIYKVFNKEDYIIITNISKIDLNIYDKIEFLKITDNLQDEIFNNNNQKDKKNKVNEWRLKTIYIRKNYDEDYDTINFFEIFPSINNFSLKFYFDFNENKFMYTDKKSGSHFLKDEIKSIIKMIKWKKDPFIQTPMIEQSVDIYY